MASGLDIEEQGTPLEALRCTKERKHKAPEDTTLLPMYPVTCLQWELSQIPESLSEAAQR